MMVALAKEVRDRGVCVSRPVSHSMRAPMFRTMSISAAPAATASAVSAALAAELPAPSGKPTTAIGLVKQPLRSAAALATCEPLTQTVAKPYVRASSQSASICARAEACAW